MHRLLYTAELMQTPLIAPQRPRIAQLDILRGIAILLVLGAHILTIPETLPPLAFHFFTTWFHVGWIGVDLFFVLSGFLVSGLLFKEYEATGSVRLMRFFIRRGFKIYPAFYVLIAVTLGCGVLFEFPKKLGAAPILGEIFFVQNYVGFLWNHTWTLAVEEHFYLLLIAAVFCMTRYAASAENPFAVLKAIIPAICLFVLGMRIYLSYRYSAGAWYEVLPYTHTRIDSLLIGVLISFYYHFEPESLRRFMKRNRYALAVVVACAFIAPIAAPLGKGRFIYSYGFTLIYLGFSALLLLSIYAPLDSRNCFGRCLRLLVPIGQRSYSMYLWHMLVYRTSVLLFDPLAGSVYFYQHIILYLGGSLLLGGLMARWVEFPALRVRDRCVP